MRTHPFWPFWTAVGFEALGVVMLVLSPLAHITPIYRYRLNSGNLPIVTGGGGIAIVLWITAICLIVCAGLPARAATPGRLPSAPDCH
jgi:hypothetical protein